MYLEKRKETRGADKSNITVTLVYHDETQGGELREATCKVQDVSQRGMGVEAPAAPSVGNDVRLKVKMHGITSEFSTITLPATIRWIGWKTEEGPFTLGVELRETMSSAGDISKWRGFMGFKRTEIF